MKREYWIALAALSAVVAIVSFMLFITRKEPLITQGPRGPEWHGRVMDTKDARVGDVLVAGPDGELTWQGHDSLEDCGDVPLGQPIIINGHCTKKKKPFTMQIEGDLHILASNGGGSWKLVPGATLDQLMAAIEKQHEELTRCGQMGDWVLDQNGNVMYRRMNPPCPTVAKPKGYGNYCDADLAEIGQERLAEKFRPRTLGCR